MDDWWEGRDKKCAQCKEEVMHFDACFNSKDICVECCDKNGGCCHG